MIPYAPGRTRLQSSIIDRLNAGQTVVPVRPDEILAMQHIHSLYGSLMQSQKAIPSLPAAFVPWKLGTPSPQTPELANAICWFGTITQAAAAAPTLTETTASGLVLTKGRTSTGFYTVSGFPTGYSVHVAGQPAGTDRAVTYDAAGQTVTIKSYNHAVIGDDILAATPLMFILMPA